MTANEWVDLTRLLKSGMPVFPGDPTVDISQTLECATDGVAVSSLHLGSHAGTHVDAPAHTVPGGRTVDQLELSELCGNAVVLGFNGLTSDSTIDVGRVSPLITAAGHLPSRVLICTLWDRRFDDTYAREHHPVLAPEAAQLLWDNGVRLLGVDTLNPDRTVQPESFRLPIHEIFLGGDGVIVENLSGLQQLRPVSSLGAEEALDHGDDWFRFVEAGVFPIPLADGDGAPCRVAARLDTTLDRSTGESS